MADIGRWLMTAGVITFGIGVLVSLGSRASWFGRLPGDVVYRGDNISVFVPLATMIVVSLVLTVVINVILRIFRCVAIEPVEVSAN